MGKYKSKSLKAAFRELRNSNEEVLNAKNDLAMAVFQKSLLCVKSETRLEVATVLKKVESKPDYFNKMLDNLSPAAREDVQKYFSKFMAEATKQIKSNKS